MQLNNTASTEENVINLARNHGTALSMLKGPQTMSTKQSEGPCFTLSLERVLIDRETGATLPFEGEEGIEGFFQTILSEHDELQATIVENRLMGMRGTIEVAQNKAIELEVTLDAGGQIICCVGPSAQLSPLVTALSTFDRYAHLASLSLGRDLELLAEGYNSTVSSALDIQLVPRTRWTLLTAHLSQTGRYARDIMRCGCSTSIRIEHNGDRAGIVAYRLATALAPLLSFMTDNVRSFRGAGARRSPSMAHARLWSEVDASRCGVVPGSLANDFTYESYLDWIEGTQAILSTDDDGNDISTGKSTVRELMESRALNAEQLHLLFHNVYPNARLVEGAVELPHADALRPRLVMGYLAFVKGLFCSELAVDTALSLLGALDERDVQAAFEALCKHGWDAEIYGKNAGQLVDELLRVARMSLKDIEERSMLENISELWEVRMVPRDAFIHQEIKQSRGW